MKSPTVEKGFVLPVVLGVGLLSILLGVAMIARSSQTRLTAIAQKETTRSLAAAEAGLTQMQALLKRYRPLTTYCSGPTVPSAQTPSPVCSGAITWQTATNGVVDTCNPSPNGPATLVQSYANSTWHNLSIDANDGQFRLVSYEYKPNTATPADPLGTGELVMEGRINPSADGSSSFRTSTARLKATFDVTDKAGLGALPGLWIQSNSSAIGPVQVKSNVRDSNCLGVSQSLKDRVQLPNYAYQITPGDAFPALPTAGATPPRSEAKGVYPLPALAEGIASLPRSGSQDTASKGFLTYRVAQKDGISINLTHTTLNLGTGAETVVLYLDGGINISGGSALRLASGSKLIIYAHGPITLAGNATTPALVQAANQPAAENIQLYSYTPSDIELSGDAPLSMFVLAPSAKVITSTPLQGNLWVKILEASGGATITQNSLNPAHLTLAWPPRISPLTAWQPQTIDSP